MLLFTIPFGGLLLMMGHQSRSEALFYYFRLEDQVPENHLLRLIDRHVNLEFIRAKLKDAYSDAGRPSIDPELLLRMRLYAAGDDLLKQLLKQIRFLESSMPILGKRGVMRNLLIEAQMYL